MKPGDVPGLARYVLRRAPQYQLDANAVIAVALQEGITGKVGDNGTSFGPWQLHQGGAYPSSAPQQPDAANAWAWSPQGVDYALSRMQSVAGGLKGRQAVRAIVYRFERPADPATEYQNAVQALPASDGGPHSGSRVATGVEDAIAGQVAGGIGTAKTIIGAPGAIVHGAEATATFLGHLTDPKYLLRGLEIAAGGLFVLFGLYLLGRVTGVAPSASSVASKAAMATPAGRAIEGASVAGRVANPAHAKAARRAALDRKYGAEAPF